MATKNNFRRLRIKKSIRNKISGTSDSPRLSVFRSNNAIYAQIINDVDGVTLASVSSLKLDTKATKTEVAKQIGINIAEAAKSKGIENVVFDRNGFLYHGRVKALAEGAREGGLKF